MENQKKLRINCDTCDARKVQESTLAAYASIHINCDRLLVDERSKELLSRAHVSVNMDQMMCLDEEVRTSTVNGRMELKPGQAAGEKQILCVNGELDIAPGCEEVLRSYLSISVNGRVICPESLAPLLAGAAVNGTIDTYPDGCIRLKSTTVLDRTFHLRTKQGAHYFAAGRVVALAPDIDFEKLAEKNVRFTTRRLLVAESLAERAVPLFDEQADITVLPDGCTFMSGGAALDEALLQRCGGKLCLNGDLTAGRDSAPLLERFTFLQVSGDILASREAAKALGTTDAVYGGLKIVGGTLLEDRASVTVDRALLEAAEDGLSFIGCAQVHVQEDVPPELLQERVVSLSGCAAVMCSTEQRAVLELVSEDVAQFDCMAPDEEETAQPDPSTVTITADCYTL